MSSLPDYEALGSFYLGREYDAERGADRPDLLLYDSRDLTTHAVCVGMTGSGKTGLCLSLLEEAAIDGVPAIAIDPKGDLGNLMLSFPELRAEDFAPWVDTTTTAAKAAETWRKGLADWDQDGARIARFRDAVDVAIYTPGSEAGRTLSVVANTFCSRLCSIKPGTPAAISRWLRSFKACRSRRSTRWACSISKRSIRRRSACSSQWRSTT
jgi:hypothetical protein